MIDVKQLRIGSHIQFNGDMVRVYSLQLTRNESMPASDTIIKTVNDDCAVFGFATDFGPIPLTAELLQELGFNLTGDWGEYQIYSKDNIAVRFVGERIYVKVSPNLATISSIRHLHELEQFVYLTIGKELVE